MSRLLNRLLDFLCDESPQNVDEAVKEAKDNARNIISEDLETALALKGLVDGMVNKYNHRLKLAEERTIRKPNLP